MEHQLSRNRHPADRLTTFTRFPWIIGFPYFHFRRIILSMPDRRVYIEAPRPGSEPKIIPAPVRGSSVT
jgi:hypothetical protein